MSEPAAFRRVASPIFVVAQWKSPEKALGSRRSVAEFFHNALGRLFVIVSISSRPQALLQEYAAELFNSVSEAGGFHLAGL